MRLLALAAILAALAAPASAQVFAIDQRVPLKLIGDDDETVSFAQVYAEGRAPATATFDSWVWTFMRSPQGRGPARWDTGAVLTRYDCRAGTQQRMRYEFYLGEVAVDEATQQEAPNVPAPDSISAAALRTVCDPTYNPDNSVLDGARGIRELVDGFFASL